MQFEWEYPVFFIVEKIESKASTVTFINLIELDIPKGNGKAVPVFTDQPGAEEFRDKNFPKYGLYSMQSKGAFITGLQVARVKCSRAAFDPLKQGLGVQMVEIDVLLAELAK